MSGDPVTLESIAAMAKERLGKEPKMLSQLSFSGDLSNLSEEDVDKLLNLVQSLQDDKSAIFDPQGRKNLKRTIQSLEGSIGLDMDTTKSNIFSAMDKEAGFMDKPFVAAKKKAIDMALGKIMSEELDDEAPKMQGGGKFPTTPPPPSSGGGSGYGGGTHYSYSGGGVGIPGYGGSTAGVDMSGDNVAYLAGNSPGMYGGAVQYNMQTALGMMPEQFQQFYNQMYAVNPEMANQYFQNAIQQQGGMSSFLGNQYIDPALYSPGSDKPFAGTSMNPFGGNQYSGPQFGGNFLGQGAFGNTFGGSGSGPDGAIANMFNNLQNMMQGNQGNQDTGLPGGADSAVGPRVYTFKDQSQIPAGFSLNKENGGMIARKKPRVYQDGGEMASDWDSQGSSMGSNQNSTMYSNDYFGAIPTPQQMMGAASAFEQYAPEASVALMREYRNILADQQAAADAASGEGGEAGVAGGVATADNPLGLSEQDLAYLEMLPPAQRARELKKLERMQQLEERGESRGKGKDWKDRTKEEKKETIKEGLKVAGLSIINPLAGLGRLTGLFDKGGKVSKKPRTYKMYQEGGTVRYDNIEDMLQAIQNRAGAEGGPSRRDRLTARYGELKDIETPNRMQQRMMNRIEQRLNRMEGRRRGIRDPRGMFGSSYEPTGGLGDLLGTGRKRITGGGDYRGGVHSGKPETMLDADGNPVSIRPGAGDMESLINLLKPYMNGSNTSPIGGNPMQSDPRPGIMTDSYGNPVMGTTNPFASTRLGVMTDADGNPVMGTTNPFASSGGSPSGLPAIRRRGGALSPFKRMDNGGSTDPKKKKVQVRGLESSLDMQIDDMIKQGVTPDFDYSGLNEQQKNALYDAEISYLKKTGQYGSEDDEMDETQPSVLPDAPRQQSLASTYGITSPADMDKPAGGFNMRPVKTAKPQEQRTVNMSQGKTVTPSRSAMPNREQREFLQMRYESSGDPNKQSAYAAGLYGISPAVMSDAAKAGAIPEGADVFDPEINKKARDWFLDSLSEQEWIKNPPKPIGQANRLARIYGAYNEGPRNFKDNLQLAKDAGIDIYGDPAGWIDAKGKGAKYDGYFFPKETRDYVRGIVLGKIDPTRVPRGYKLSN